MIYLIAAVDSKFGISKGGLQPWNIPDDIAYYVKRVRSEGANQLIGASTFRKNLNSKALSKVNNFVLTSHPDNLPSIVKPVTDLDNFLLDYSKNQQNIWIAGGESVYAQVLELKLVDKIYLTEIEADFGCDQFIPNFAVDFKLTTASDTKEQSGFKYRYCEYSRILL